MVLMISLFFRFTPRYRLGIYFHRKCLCSCFPMLLTTFRGWDSMRQSFLHGRKQKSARVRAHCEDSVCRRRASCKKVPGCGCTDGQACLHRCTDIARINPHEQEGNSRIANAGGDCGSALARSNLLLFTVWRVGATGD